MITKRFIARSVFLVLALVSIDSYGQKQSLKQAIKYYDSKNLVQAEKEIDKASKSSFTSNEEVCKTMYYFFVINSEIYNSSQSLIGNEQKIEEMVDAFKLCKKHDAQEEYLPELNEKALAMEGILLEAAKSAYAKADHVNYFSMMDCYTHFKAMLDDDNGAVYLELAKNAKILKLYQRSVVYWYKAIQANHETEYAYGELLSTLYEMEDYSQVDNFLRQAKQDFPNSKAFAQVEIKRFIDKDLNFSALKLTSELIETDPSNVEILYLHGYLNSQLNEHEVALQSFLKAANIDSEHFKTQFELGLHYFKFANKDEGHTEKAKKYLEKAYMLNNRDEMTRSLLHDVYVELGLVQKAIQLLADGN